MGEAESSDGRIRSFIRKRPVLSLTISGIATLLIGVGIGGAPGQSEISDLEDQVASLTGDLDAAEADVDDAERRADEAVAANDELAAKVEEFQNQKDDLAAQEDQLASQAQDLDAREAEISEAEQTLESSTIPDGTWQLGVDYEPGTYRSEGGGGCYWEKLDAPSGKLGDIIANGGFNPNQTLVIDSPYFHTADCGEWVKIG